VTFKVSRGRGCSRVSRKKKKGRIKRYDPYAPVDLEKNPPPDLRGASTERKGGV